MAVSAKENRNTRLDLVRTLAIIAVVWIHCQENGNFSLSIGPVPVDAVTYLFGRMGVPLFLMLTGALLIPREIRPLRFYLTRLLPLYLVSALWIFLYSLPGLVRGAAGLTAGAVLPAAGAALVRALCLTPSEKHLWYLGVIFAVYLLMPLLAQLKRCRTVPLAGIVLGLLAITGLRLAAGVSHIAADIALYIAYVLAGYLLTDRLAGRAAAERKPDGYAGAAAARPRPVRTAALRILTAFSAALFVFTYVHDRFRNAFAVRGLDVWWYYSPFIILTAVLLFAALYAGPAPSGRAAGVLRFLSENSFGVYLVHLFVIRGIFRGAFFTDTARTSAGTAALAALGTLAISYAISAVCGKIPGLRRLFLKKSLQKS